MSTSPSPHASPAYRWTRGSTAYGPWGRPDMALFMFARNILEGKPIDVFNSGHHKRDFTFVEDIAEGVVRVLERIPQPDQSAARGSRAMRGGTAGVRRLAD
jgi:nucleoside-diphosphate-sugar epimerase